MTKRQRGRKISIFQSGENGRELQKGDKYDWKQEDDTYTLTINNPQLDDDGDCDHSTFRVE